MLLPRRLHVSPARLVALIALLALLLAVVSGLAFGARLYRHVSALKQRVDAAAMLFGNDTGRLNADTLEALRREVDGGRQDYLALKRDVAPLMRVAQALAWLPRVGPTLGALPHVLNMGEAFLSAGSALLELSPLLDAVQGKAGSTSSNLSVTERVLPLLLDAQPSLVAAQDALERAASERDAIDSALLLPVVARQLQRLDRYLPAARSAAQAAAVAPILLGAVRPMTYLLIAQNNDELRPTGGFISAVGVLTLDKGKIVRLDLKDSGSVDNWERDHPAPPEPLLRYMGSELWVMRDANFWPDFPTSARALEYFAELDMDLRPDGVIAVDQFALQILVGGMGSVVIPQHDNDVLTRDNTIDKIRDYWEPPPGFVQDVAAGKASDWAQWVPWYNQRKQFLSHLVQAMRDRLESAQSLNMAQLGKAVLEALDEKHILIYLREPLGGGLSDQRWGGAIPATAGDYLMVVDTNMGFNKANGVVKRSLDYAVSIDAAGMARGRVAITYNNTSKRDVECLYDSYYEGSYELLMNRCYWNYLRVYVPVGATVIADENGNDMESAGMESGKQVWASWLVIPPREKPQAAMGYYLPRSVLQRRGDTREYHLLVQKQPGTDTTPLRVTVTLPAGSGVISASPAATSISGNQVVFTSNLETDVEFRVVIR